MRWKKRDKSEYILQLLGPRQVGKTTEVKKFAYSNYEYVIYVNLAADIDDFSSTILDRTGLLDPLTKFCIKANLPPFKDCNKTILILDEVQANYKIYNLLRELREWYKIDILVTGSYLGITYFNREYFIPAGTAQPMSMTSISFSEFCNIFGARKLLENIDIFRKGNSEDYNKIYNLYDIYRQIGGYPEVVKRYIDTKNVNECSDVFEKLLNNFNNESRTYLKNEDEVNFVEKIYRESVKQMITNKGKTGGSLISDVRDVIKGSTDKLVTKKDVNKAVSWLIYNGVLGLCSLYLDGKMFNKLSDRRIYYSDCGLASYICKKTGGLDKTNIEGLLTETFVYNELNRLHNINIRNNLVKESTPGFSILGQYELDFMEETMDGVTYGIEIKTKDGDPKSLKVYIQRGLVDKGIVAKRTIGNKGDKISTIPIWAVGCRFPYFKT